MMKVIGCITSEHNLWLVGLAALVCTAGCWSVVSLFQRVASTNGVQRAGWYFLSAAATGSAVWCTHFIAMLAYQPGTPFHFDPALTVLSLLLAMVGASLAFIVATNGEIAWGGIILGLTIAGMHYAGIAAYHVQGLVFWDAAYVVASLFLVVLLSVSAMYFTCKPEIRNGKFIAMGALVGAIVSLHFVGMTAIRVTPILDGIAPDAEPMQVGALALGIACIALVIDGGGLMSYFIDDRSRAETLQRLKVQAMQDPLTGLPNRASFESRLDSEIELSRKIGAKFALIGIDLNHFKEINDLHGHAAGDTVLKVLGRRLLSVVRENEFVKRLGGDEFAAIHRISDATGLEEFLSRIQIALSGKIKFEDCDIMPEASIGVAIYPDHADDKETLIINADLAMYRSKADPNHAVCFFEHSMDVAVRARRLLCAELGKSIENNQLELHYQIQTSIASGEATGYEALLRWKHPQRGFVPPSEFIPLAEESGFILKLGEWVLWSACAEAVTWSAPYKVAVNISPVQFLHADLPKLVLEVLAGTGLPSRRLELELTETTIFTDKDRALHILRKIRALGVGIALDDFGTGYSSLDTLRTFPFDKIKLDRSFMNEIDSSPQSRAIVHAVLALGKCLGIPVLAEGIETNSQLSILAEEACDEAQGYLLGRPAPISSFTGAIRKQATRKV